MLYHPSSTLPHSIPESQVEEDEFVGGDEDAAAGRRREVLGVAETAVAVAKAGILLVNLLGNFTYVFVTLHIYVIGTGVVLDF